jgi:hypothetical protein
MTQFIIGIVLMVLGLTVMLVKDGTAVLGIPWTVVGLGCAALGLGLSVLAVPDENTARAKYTQHKTAAALTTSEEIRQSETKKYKQYEFLLSLATLLPWTKGK